MKRDKTLTIAEREKLTEDTYRDFLKATGLYIVARIEYPRGRKRITK